MQFLRIAFLACNKNPLFFLNDASYRYRCENLALMLREQGHQVELTHYKNFKPKGKHYDIIVFHRPSDNWYFRRALARCRNTGARLIADIDDLIIHPQWAEYSPGVLNKRLSLRKTKSQYQKNFLALKKFKYFTTSTIPLANKLQQHFEGNIEVLQNAPHRLWQSISPTINQESKLLITYFPGTASHDRDFASIQEPIKAFLADNPNARLSITGTIDTLENINPAQIQYQNKLPFEAYAAEVATSWVNLSPLESTPFNDCKSALKTIEASFWNKPTISSPNPDSLRYDGCGAIIAKTPDDWYTHLASLVDQKVYDSHTKPMQTSTDELANSEDITYRFLSLGGIE